MAHWVLSHPSALAAAVALAALWLLESVAPFFLHRTPRAPHGARNITLGLINGALRAAFFPAALFAAATVGEERSWGLLRIAGLPIWANAILAVLLLDLVNYAWHVASHHWRWLWRFHAVHHHDDAVDATTAFRFHAGDVILNALVVVVAVAALGLRVEHVLLYEAILLPVSIFHHGNIRISERLDRILRTILVTPRMHWVHHSRWVRETDSNFAGIFSFWDRIFGTFRLRADPATLELGLDGYDPADHRTLKGCLLTPFGPVKSLPGRAPDDAAYHDNQGGNDAGGRSRPLASPSTHPSRGRRLPLALAVADHTPLDTRTLRPCPTQRPQPSDPAFPAD